MEWNIGSCLRRISDTDLADLQEMAVDLLDLLKSNLPDKCGEKGGWNFDKAHSILHKVREIIMWGNSDNTSCQSAEHADIVLIKVVAGCTNNKDVVLCILRFHARRAYLQHYQTLLRSWRVWKNSPQRLRQSKRPERALTLMSKSALCCTIGISTWPVRQVFDTPHTR